MCFNQVKLKHNRILPHLTQYSVLTLIEFNVSNHNRRLLADHFLDPQVHSNCFVNNKPVFDRKLTFIDHVSQSSTVGQDVM